MSTGISLKTLTARMTMTKMLVCLSRFWINDLPFVTPSGFCWINDILVCFFFFVFFLFCFLSGFVLIERCSHDFKSLFCRSLNIFEKYFFVYLSIVCHLNITFLFTILETLGRQETAPLCTQQIKILVRSSFNSWIVLQNL